MVDDMILKKSKKISETLKVLANENRLMILCYLIDKPMNVSELHEKMQNLTQSALSQHLSILKSNGILDNSKKGLNITYFIKDERIVNVMETLRKNYCEEE